MGKGRAPCCDKTKVKRGPWSPAEDMRLTSYIQKHGHANWRALPKHAGLMRCGKSCRLRWINYLRPDVKRGNFTSDEEQIVIRLHNKLGNKWSKIASYLPGRTDNEIKNVWNTHIKKKLQAVTESTSRHSHVTESNPSIASSDMEITSEELGIAEYDILKPANNPGDGFCVSDSPTASYASSVTTHEGGLKASLNPNNGGSGSESNDNKIVIPFEPDVDYWKLLDTVDQKRDCTGNQDNDFGDSHGVGSDYRQWLRLLESELELTSEVHADVQFMEQNAIPLTQQVLDLELGTSPEWKWFVL